jgi:two-component system sporulation sensor kinase A
MRQEWLEKSKLSEKQFRLQLSENLPQIRADAAQTRMLFDAVLSNAVEAVENESDPQVAINCRGNLTDERIMIEVRDNGSGMSPEVLEQAITPFYSYRPAGRRRGLGLSRATRYAQINGGRIRLSSELNKGTTVFIELPIAHA